MTTRKSFREIAQWIDDRSIEYELSSAEYKLRSLAKQHRWFNSADAHISFRNIIDRHKGGLDSKEISLLFYNTWLLDGVAGFGGKPFRSLRADLIGKEIRNSGYDIAALCEVFEEKYQRIIKKQRFPYDAMGPVWTVGNISSGLYTLSKFPLKYKRNRFIEKGPDLISGVIIDSVLSSVSVISKNAVDKKSNPDYHSNKGVLLTTIDLGIGKIDLYTTHLFWGSGEFNPIEKTKIQLEQLKELTEFIKETHNPKHVVIVAGDMNINPGRSKENDRAYEKMTELFSNITLKNGSKISLEDLWKIKGGKKGGTNMPTKGCEPEDRVKNLVTGICYCNDDTDDVKDLDEGRYDCIFVQKPSDSHDIVVDFSRMKRRPFPFPELKFEDIKNLLAHPILIQDPEFVLTIRNMNSTQLTEYVSYKIKEACKGHLSDHIGVDVKMLINKN